MNDQEQPDDRGAASGDGTRTLRIEISSTTIWQVIGAVAVTLLAVRMASAARGLLTLVALAFFFSLALEPAVRRLTARFGWRRGAAVGVIYGLGVAALVFLVFILVPSIAQLADRIAEDGAQWVADLNAWSRDTLGLPLDLPASDDAAATAGDRVGAFGGQAFGALVGIASRGLGLVFSVATLAMFTFYFSADAPKVQRAVLRMFSPAAQERIGWTWDQAIVQTGGYFYSRLLLMGVNGVGFFITMALVGVPIGLAVSLAVVAAFVSVFIPA
ncbi:MAG TPA: AI-2E family transporter, partial [Pseudomonadales bacterium]|nr:AI-2E family transporter [Pseudomonadales bacterium]